MKLSTHTLALVAAGTVLVAPLAQAQSAVTLYGRVVGGAEYIDKIQDPTTGRTGSLSRAADNQWGTSLLGFKGAEDLGGGLKADFTLEGGFGLKNGLTNGEGLFNRRAYVGLSDARWGSFRLGKNLNISNDVWYLDPTGQQFVSSATLVRGRSWQGANNVIEYSTPTYAGFAASTQFSLGEQVDSSRASSSRGISLSYLDQNLELRAIHSQRWSANTTFDNVYLSSRETTVGGTYRIGAAKLFAACDYITAPDAALAAPSKLRHGWLGVRYDLPNNLQLVGAVYRVISDRADGRATLFMLGADYYLSKRTFLYASFGGVSNSRTGNFAADVTVGGPGAGASQKTVYAGMGHSF